MSKTRRGLPLLISLYLNEKDSAPKVKTLTWDQLAIELQKIEETACNPCPQRSDGNCVNKYGEAWSPAGYEKSGLARSSELVTQFSCVVFDLDDVTLDQVAVMQSALTGVEYVAHSTHNHGIKGIRLRLVLPFAEPFKREGRSDAQFKKAWQDWRQGCIEKFKIPADPSCKDLSRIYFFGSCPKGAGSVEHREPGVALKWQDVEPKRSKEIVSTTSAKGAQGVERGDRVISNPQIGEIIDLEDARRRLRSALPPDVAKRILAGEALAQEGSRDNTLNAVVSKIAWALPTLAEGALLELLRPSIAAMLPPEGVDFWLAEARDSHKRATQRRIETVAAEEKERRETREAYEEFSKTNTPDNQQEPPTPEDWRSLLRWVTNSKTGAEHVKNTAGNLSIFLRHDPIWRGSFRLNELTHQIDIFGGPLDINTSPDAFASEVSDWFMNRATEPLELPDHIVKSRIFAAAQKHSFDPLKEHIRQLKSAGGGLIDTWAEKYLGAKTVNDLGEDITEHVRKVSRKWLVQAIARALDPGCQADACLILEGNQRIGKTSALRILGGPFHKEAALDLASKDSLQSIAEMWIVELAELAALRSSETERQKDFLTRRNDFFRLPYASGMQSFPRRCVFAGTTNGDDYLKDTTGNSRYWIIACQSIDLEGLARDRDQLFAEALEIYEGAFVCPDCKYGQGIRCENHNWWLSPEDRAVAERQAEQRMEDDGIPAQVYKWWVRQNPKDRVNRFTTLEVACALGVGIHQASRGLRTRIGMALHSLGFKRRRTGYGMTYCGTDELIGLPFNALGIVADAEIRETKRELRS